MNQCNLDKKVSVACFITPHGLGHAARAAAVMSALQERVETDLSLFTAVPEWFFAESLQPGFTYHNIVTDIGLVQKSPLEEDLDLTCDRLDGFLPFDHGLIRDLAAELRENECRLVLCDIAPLGIAVAKEAGIPSVLIENFTWDWIYQGYERDFPRLTPHIQYLQQVFSKVDYHIQTEPVCRPIKNNLRVQPVSRKVEMPAGVIREQLKAGTKPMILITMGGIAGTCAFLEQLTQCDEFVFLLPGTAESLISKDNLRQFPFQSGFHHPDLINASAAVIGKVGYSTLAEVYQCGVPFGYIPRSAFRESVRLTEFIRERMSGMEIDESLFNSGEWLQKLPELVAMKRRNEKDVNGADQVADFLVTMLTAREFEK